MTDISAKKIMVVDDEADVLEYLSNILRRHNYNVISTSKGREALELAQSHLPDLIILDIALPDIDGGEVASALADNASTSGIPIIFLTALMRKEEEELLGKTGRRYIIAKPAMKEQILGMIKKIIK